MGQIPASLDELFADPATVAARAALHRRWVEIGAFRGETLIDIVERAAAEDPDASVVFASDTHPGVTRLGELVPRYREVAGAFRALGIGQGDVVAIQLPNWPVTLEVYLGAVAVGAVIVPIVHTYGPAETGWILEASGASVLVCPDRWTNIDFHGRLDAMPWAESGRVVMVGDDAWPAALSWSDFMGASAGPVDSSDIEADDPLLVIYTSGTTAEPKGVLHSHHTFLAELFRMTQAPAERRDWVVVQPWPAGHVAGVMAILSPAITPRHDHPHRPLGYRSVLRLRRALPTYRTDWRAVPPQRDPHAAEAGALDVSSIRYAVTGGASVPPVLVERADAVGWSLTRSYGSSEHPQATATRFDDPVSTRIATDGSVIVDTEMRIVDPDGDEVPTGVAGEVLLRGPQQFLGYTDPELNVAAIDSSGWFHTDDVGFLDRDGRLTITDRLKDIIIRGGENLSSMEIEGITVRHPSVVDAAAIGVPDDRYGERIGIVIVIAPGTELVTVEDLQTFFAFVGVAKTKAPEFVAAIDELPRNATGKVKKHVLRETINFSG